MLSEERPTLRFEERDHPAIYRPKPKWKLLSLKDGANIPEDEDLLFASPVVYGLSLSDNIWRKFRSLYNIRQDALTTPMHSQSHSMSTISSTSSGMTKHLRASSFRKVARPSFVLS